MDLSETPRRAGARHPWERSRAEFFIGLAEELGLLDAERILDTGAGDGWFAEALLPLTTASITCWDTHYTDAHLRAPSKDPRVERCREAPTGPFDLTLVLDVLEHVEDDAGLLASLGGLTRPGGHLLISVPGWPALYGTHDRQLRHHRRYLPRRAMGLLRKSGFSILRQGGLFHSLLSVRTGELLRERLLGSPVRAERELAWHHGPAVTRAIMSLLRLDNALSRWTSAHDISLPGLSWWAVCRYDENELTDRGGG